MGSLDTLMVGTLGWDHVSWISSYYPEELPADWRFGYYSNEYRAVLVPADHWNLNQPLADWVQDADDAFRMVLELPSDLARPAGDWVSRWQQFLGESELLRPFRRGYMLSLLPGQEVDLAWLEAVLAAVTSQAPLSVDLRGNWRSSIVGDFVQSHGATLCWHTEDDEFVDPSANGLWVAISTESDARLQRAVIERIGAWMERTSGEAGLFFTGEHAPAAAASARLIAEMLVI